MFNAKLNARWSPIVTSFTEVSETGLDILEKNPWLLKHDSQLVFEYSVSLNLGSWFAKSDPAWRDLAHFKRTLESLKFLTDELKRAHLIGAMSGAH